jgi:hypothetical protein
MEGQDLLKEQSIFAYKSAARLLLALGTILLIFGLTLLKVISDEGFAQSKRGRDVVRKLDTIQGLMSALPIGKLDWLDSATVYSIDLWNYHHGELVRRSECDKGGALFWLFMPEEDTVSVPLNTLLARLKTGIHILRHEVRPKDTNLESLYLAPFVLRGNDKDYRVLADKFQKGDFPDSEVNSWKEDFKKIDFRPDMRRQTWDFDTEHLAGLWLPLIDSLKAISQTYPTIYEGLEATSVERLSFNNLRQLSDSLLAKQPPIGDLKLGAGVEFQGKDAFRLLGFVVLFSVYFIHWFLRRAQKFEAKYSERLPGIGSELPMLSSVSSGVIHFLEHNTPRILLGGRSRGRGWWVRLGAWLCALLWLIPLVVLPFVASIVVPAFMETLIPHWNGFGPLVYECLVPGLVLMLSLDIYLRILEPVWTRKFNTFLGTLPPKLGSKRKL